MGTLPCPTNVVKLYNLCVSDDQQLTYYHPGVGAEGGVLERVLERVLGGGVGLGLGLGRNLGGAYRWLCDHYRKGDRIFLFGFSRGAYTVRSLGGFIARGGLLDLAGSDEGQAWKLVERACEHGYRKRQAAEEWAAGGSFLPGDLPDGRVGIQLIGIGNTVGALGVPDDLVLLDQLLDDPGNYRFHDTDLSLLVRHGRHALAMDEQRASFAPTLWTDGRRLADGSLQQLWFVGTHSDVGGGYAECGLSDGPLQWMIDEAAALGLRVKPALLRQLEPGHTAALRLPLLLRQRRLGSSTVTIAAI